MKRLFSLLLLGCLAGTTALASTVVGRINIETLVLDSQRVFLGTCVGVDSKRDGHGLPSTTYAFRVNRAFKGISEEEIYIKQFGVLRTLPDGTNLRVTGVPEYTVGESYVLFMTEESRLGFSSPKGLGQGAFRIYLDPATRKQAVVNGNQNLNLFENLNKVPSQIRSRMVSRDLQGPLFLDDFLSIIANILKN